MRTRIDFQFQLRKAARGYIDEIPFRDPLYISPYVLDESAVGGRVRVISVKQLPVVPCLSDARNNLSGHHPVTLRGMGE